MAIFYIKVEMIDGLRMMTGCTESKEYAEQQWGLGKYAKVLADNAHEVKSESIKQGLTDKIRTVSTHMNTPVGKMPIRKEVVCKFVKMTDRQIADQALKSGPFIDPEYFAELVHRGLSWRGCTTDQTYDLIAERKRPNTLLCGSCLSSAFAESA